MSKSVRELTQKYSQQRGFSMPEVILIVAVLAIVAGMAFPDLATFFERQRIEQERIELEEIKNAMDAYSQQCGMLPDLDNNPTSATCRDENPGGSATWAEALAEFSNLSAGAIEVDQWGNPRKYTMQSNSVNFMGNSSLTFYYATLRSIGGNQCDDLNNPCNSRLAGLQSYISTIENPDWATISEYGSFGAEGDDLVVKFTDNQAKSKAYETTLERLERIISALDRYAQTKFNTALVTSSGDACVNNKLYYPPSNSGGWGTEWPGADVSDLDEGPCPLYSSLDLYDSEVKSDTTNIVGQQYVNTESLTYDTRKTAMEGLMRMLGLPLNHCCSAISGEPFYYYSSPGVDRSSNDSGDCVYNTQPPYFPPRVSLTADSCP